jgi:hypothetical protein
MARAVKRLLNDAFEELRAKLETRSAAVAGSLTKVDRDAEDRGPGEVSRRVSRRVYWLQNKTSPAFHKPFINKHGQARSTHNGRVYSRGSGNACTLGYDIWRPARPFEWRP